MTDADAVEDSDEPAMAFMDAMVRPKYQSLPMKPCPIDKYSYLLTHAKLALDFFISFMSLVKRLNEQVREDADALHNALGKEAHHPTSLTPFSQLSSKMSWSSRLITEPSS